MARRSAVYTFALVSALVAPALVGCQASFQAGAKKDEAPPPPPPPAAEPAPAPAPEPAAEPAAAETPKAKPEVKDGKINIPGNIVFDTGKATIKEGDAGSQEVLAQVKAFLDDNPRVSKLRIEGHTDNVGADDANLELSGQRALTVKKWLIDQGVKPDRVIAVGFGEGKPVADNTTAEGKAQNRRTEFHIAGLDGKRFLGRDPAGGGKLFK